MDKQTKLLFLKAMLHGHERAGKYPNRANYEMEQAGHYELEPGLWKAQQPYRPLYWILDEHGTAHAMYGHPEDLG